MGTALQGNFYKTFTRPFALTFLGALLTYQLAYYAWLQLEHIETKAVKDGKGPSSRGRGSEVQAS
jgi:hypothetical protein